MNIELAAVLDPIAVALKFGFLAVLYLFVLWVARSIRKDLRPERAQVVSTREEPVPAPMDDATGMISASQFKQGRSIPSHLRIIQTDSLYDLSTPIILGRGDRANVQIEDPYASHRHAQITPEGEMVILEDLGSTNGTFLNGTRVHGPQPIYVGDSLTIGDFEVVFEQ
jgi:pSer/pThr/pTyr-binding forkhead associated (FHA) protein